MQTYLMTKAEYKNASSAIIARILAHNKTVKAKERLDAISVVMKELGSQSVSVRAAIEAEADIPFHILNEHPTLIRPYQMSRANFAVHGYPKASHLPAPSEAYPFGGTWLDFFRLIEIKQALREGKRVPAEVLSEYPDFA